MGITWLVKNFDKHSWAVWERKREHSHQVEHGMTTASIWGLSAMLNTHSDISSGIDQEERCRMAQIALVIHETKNYHRKFELDACITVNPLIHLSGFFQVCYHWVIVVGSWCHTYDMALHFLCQTGSCCVNSLTVFERKKMEYFDVAISILTGSSLPCDLVPHLSYS